MTDTKKHRCPAHGAPLVLVPLCLWEEGPPDPNGYECGCDYGRPVQRPSEAEPTQADHLRANAFLNLFRGDNMLTEKRLLAKEFAAVRREAAEGQRPETAQHRALRLVVEHMLDDLIESGNGFELDGAWVETSLTDMFEARDNPEAFLARLDADGTATPKTEIVGAFPAGQKTFYVCHFTPMPPESENTEESK